MELVNSRDKIVSLAIAGGLLLIVGVWTTSWWTVDMALVSMKVGLREVRVCAEFSACMSVPFESATWFATSDARAFARWCKYAYLSGMLAGILLVVHAFAVSKRGEYRVGIAAAVAAGGCGLFALAAVASKPAAASNMMAIGFSPILTFGGIALGLGSVIPGLLPTAVSSGVAGIGDKLHRAALGPLADLDTAGPRAKLPTVRTIDDRSRIGTPPAASVAPAAAAHSISVGDTHDDAAAPATRGGIDDERSASATPGGNYDERIARAAPAREHVAGSPMLGKQRQAVAQRVRDVAVDRIAESLRFVARDCDIHADGLVADRGGEMSWQRIARVVMRQLPPDAPFESALMLDVVPESMTGERVTPIRIMATTRVNYAALPGGAAASSRENLKKLAVFVREQNPRCELDGQPPRFAGTRQFLDYDAQYG